MWQGRKRFCPDAHIIMIQSLSQRPSTYNPVTLFPPDGCQMQGKTLDNEGAFIPKYQSLFFDCLHFEDEGTTIIRNIENDTALVYKGKGKEIPVQASTGPEVSMRLRHPDFKKIGT